MSEGLISQRRFGRVRGAIPTAVHAQTVVVILGELTESGGDLQAAVPLYLHAERMFRDVDSVHAAVPAEALQRLAAQLPAERWEELHSAGERMAWEDVVEQSRRSLSYHRPDATSQ